MNLPTLFKKGNLVAQPGESQEKLNSIVPIDAIMKHCQSRLPTNEYRPDSIRDKLLMILAATGSGKSTIIPTELYHRFYNIVKKNIGITQPTRLTTIEIPNTILPYNSASYLEKRGIKREPLILGYNIGYQTGSLSKKSSRGINFMTIGVLKQQLITMTDEELIKTYAFIMVDEAHKRTTEMDMTLYLLKKFLHRCWNKPGCPLLIITSATFDPYAMGKYIIDSEPYVINVRGQSYPITENFVDLDISNIYASATETVDRIHKSNEDDYIESDLSIGKDRVNRLRDIIVFLTTTSDIKKMKKLIDSVIDKDSYYAKFPIAVLALTSASLAKQSIDYKNIFLPIEEVTYETENNKFDRVFRRVILATNVAETGITIDTLKYIIDTGTHLNSEYNPNYNCSALIRKPITKSMSIQRRGRVGRKGFGIWYPLYTESTFNKLSDDIPGIYNEDLSLDILLLLINIYDTGEFKTRGISGLKYSEIDISKIDLPEKLPLDTIHASINKLYNLGFIDERCFPTVLAEFVVKFRKISIETIKFILAGYVWGVSTMDIITIAAYLNIKSNELFKDRIYEDYILHADDLISFLILFYKYKNLVDSQKLVVNIYDIKKWCKSRGINFDIWRELCQLRDELLYTLYELGLGVKYSEDSIYYGISDKKISAIKKCIYEAFRLNILQLSGYKYIGWSNYISVPMENVDLPLEKPPKYIIYTRLTFMPNDTGMYTPTLENICVMDGYVPVDKSLI